MKLTHILAFTLPLLVLGCKREARSVPPLPEEPKTYSDGGTTWKIGAVNVNGTNVSPTNVTVTIPDLAHRLDQIATQAREADSTALAYKLSDELSNLPNGLDAVDPILRFMEDHPDFYFGSPGPLVHFVETFYRKGYEERLCRSIRRRPTGHTVWMLNRLINGSKGDAKSNYVGLLDEVLARPDLNAETLAQAREFRNLHK
jgi:hypothetical protein